MPASTTRPAIPTSSTKGAPATKYITPQPNSTRHACPKSGCSASINTIEIHKAKDHVLPGGPLISSAAAIIHAATTTKPGLRNSDGWKDAKPIEYQRTAPLPKSVPKNGSRASATKERRKPTIAKRRTIIGVIIDVSTIAITASTPKTACRCT